MTVLTDHEAMRNIGITVGALVGIALVLIVVATSIAHIINS